MGDTVIGLAALVILAISIRLWVRAIKRVEIPANRVGFVAAWIVVAGMGVTALAGEPGGFDGIPAGLALFASLFFLFTVAIGAQKVGEDR